MKKIIAILLVMFLHSLASANGEVEINISEAQKAGHVVVKPSNAYSFSLDGYKIPKDAKLITLHVLDSPRSHYYYQDIKPDKSVYNMTESELKSTTGSPPFKGLTKNDSAFLIIGSETEPGSINMGILYSNVSIAIIVRK